MMASSNSGALIGSSSTVGGINVAGMGVVGGGGASAAATGGSGGGGGVDELLPLVKQLTNPDQVNKNDDYAGITASHYNLTF
jgi:hypothetical protein